MTLPPTLAGWLADMSRMDRIRLLGALVDTETIRELARWRRADVAAEIAERGYGGRKTLAADLGIVRMATISEAVAQHRRETVSYSTEESTD